jgi:hypothetical protein
MLRAHVLRHRKKAKVPTLNVWQSPSGSYIRLIPQSNNSFPSSLPRICPLLHFYASVPLYLSPPLTCTSTHFLIFHSLPTYNPLRPRSTVDLVLLTTANPAVATCNLLIRPPAMYARPRPVNTGPYTYVALTPSRPTLLFLISSIVHLITFLLQFRNRFCICTWMSL